MRLSNNGMPPSPSRINPDARPCMMVIVGDSPRAVPNGQPQGVVPTLFHEQGAVMMDDFPAFIHAFIQIGRHDSAVLGGIRMPA